METKAAGKKGKEQVGRYVSFKMDKVETYIEDVPMHWSQELLEEVMTQRLEAVKKALPKAEWSLEVVNVYGGRVVDNFESKYETIFSI